MSSIFNYNIKKAKNELLSHHPEVKYLIYYVPDILSYFWDCSHLHYRTHFLSIFSIFLSHSSMFRPSYIFPSVHSSLFIHLHSVFLSPSHWAVYYFRLSFSVCKSVDAKRTSEHKAVHLLWLLSHVPLISVSCFGFRFFTLQLQNMIQC